MRKRTIASGRMAMSAAIRWTALESADVWVGLTLEEISKISLPVAKDLMPEVVWMCLSSRDAYYQEI